jgi:hypothetical protein
MWIPQILFCLGAMCYIGAGTPQDTEAQCREHLVLVMMVEMRQVLPQAGIRAIRCFRDDTPT